MLSKTIGIILAIIAIGIVGMKINYIITKNYVERKCSDTNGNNE